MSHAADLPDFDKLVAMHQSDPEAFEAYRRHLLRMAIDDAPEEQRPALDRLLVRIEATRAAAETPEQAAFAAFSMMRESVTHLGAAWEMAQHALAGLQTEILLFRVRQ